jgi:hypothetical protein
LSVSPSHPAMQSREEPGTTLIVNLIVNSPHARELVSS